jgi:hypothetical protein
MKTDRELLELAAKAVGYKVDEKTKVSVFAEQNWLPMIYPQKECPNLWNPLINDTDAFRLAVKLRIDVSGNPKVVFATDGFGPCAEHVGDDPYAATRRAIVRVAAAIGESMP